MNMLEENVLETIKKNHLIEENDLIILGVSGGPDSTCLFHIFLSLQERLHFRFFVCHINHGIRKEAKMDEQYVKKMCETHNIPCYIKRENIQKQAKQAKIGLEEMGRKVRYEFFLDIKNKTGAKKIATAKTKHDSVETVLMNLIRGTGISGLKGIEAKRDNTYIRPLIESQREEIEQYCKEKELNPKIDSTNFDNTYTRNKIRNNLIPYLKKEFNPSLVEAISRMSAIIKEEDQYLEIITKESFKQICMTQRQEEIILDLKKFNQFDLVIKKRIVLYTITMLFGASLGIEKKHIEDIIQLCANNIGNKFLIPNKKIKILVKKQKIFFTKNQ